MNDEPEISESSEKYISEGSVKYIPELYITFESFEQEGLEYFRAKDAASCASAGRAADGDSASTAESSEGWFSAAVGAFFKKQMSFSKPGTTLMDIGWKFLVTDLGGMVLSKVSKAMIDEFALDKLPLVGFLFEYKKETQDTYKQILALAESQVIINSKLDKIYDAVTLTTLNNCLNEKTIAYNEILNVDKKTSALIQGLKDSYEDVMENGTEEEKKVAEEIIEKQMKKILSEWGNVTVNKNTHYLNAYNMMENYMTEFSCAPEPRMTYIDMYDYVASKIYGWEAEGYEMRELFRTTDKAVIAQDVTLAMLYYRSVGNNEEVEKLQAKYDELMTFCEKKRINFDYSHVICQIKGLEKKTFEAELGLLTSADMYDTMTSYSWSWDKENRERLDLSNWAVANRIRFGIHWDDANWDSFKQPEILSMEDYQKIVNYYDNTLTLREIFQDHAHFDKANRLLPNYGDREDTKGVHSFVYNNANYADWWSAKGAANEYFYYSVTDLNSKTLISQNSSWNETYHTERDFKFFWGMNLESHDGGKRNNGYFATMGHCYTVCWPVVVEK